MALSDTITSLGTSIINLVGTRAKKDMSNLTTAGENVIKGLASGVPTGTVIAYMGTTAPDGFLLMDGREVSKTTYADLYAVVGDSMGTATDNTKFVIADMTDGRYLMGSTVAGSSESAKIPNITGCTGFASSNVIGSGAFLGPLTSCYGATGASYTTNKNVFFDASLCSTVYSDSATTVVPESLKTLFYIRF